MSTDIELRISADVDQATKGIGGFRREYQEMVRAVEKPLRGIDTLQKTQESAKAASTAYFEARKRVDDLKRAIQQAGQEVPGLNRQYQQAQRTLASATREFERQKTQVREQRAELRGAGVDTRNLATEQQRLQVELARRMAAGREDAARQAALDKLGVSRVRELRAQLVAMRADYDRLTSGARLSATERIALEQRYRQQLSATRAELAAMAGQQAARASGEEGGALGIFGRAAGVAAGAFTAVQSLRAWTSVTDRIGEMNDRLRNATRSQEELNLATERLREISDRTYTDLANNADLFIGSLAPLREIGFELDDVLNLTEALGLGLVASATKGDQARAVIDQFNKAMQVGVLRGDAFNSVIQQAPELANALAEGLGVTRQELIGLAEAGELTSQRVIPALISQLPELGKKVDDMRVTVGDGVLRFRGALERTIVTIDDFVGFSEKLAKSFSDLAASLNQLNDGNYAEGFQELLEVLAGNTGLGQIAKWAGFIDQLKGAYKSLVGSADEVIDSQDKLQLQLSLSDNAELDRNIRRLAEEQRALAAQKGIKFDELESLRGWASAMGTTYEEFIAREQERNRIREAGERGHKKRMSDARARALQDLQRDISAQQALLEKANGKLKQARDNELAVEKEFNQLISDIRNGGSQGAGTFSDVISLKASSRQALVARDYERAIADARKAGEILKQLQQAGEADFGFAGIAMELGDIAKEASKLERVDVEAEVKDVEARLVDLLKQAEALKVISVEVNWDEANEAQIVQKMRDLAAKISKAMIISPTVLLPDGSLGGGKAEPSTSVPALATGGILRGPGTGTSDSILARLSNGEGVINARAVQYYGADLIHQLNNLRTPRFATGGVMGNVPVPSIPSLAPALQQQLASGSGVGSNEDWGSMVIDLGNGPAPIRMPRSTAEALRREALKRGSPGRAR